MAMRTDLKIPYGVSDFKTIRTEGLYYVDKTEYLAKMEERDRFALLWLGFCGLYLFCGCLAGGLKWWYFPALKGVMAAPMTISFYLVYLALCLTPVILHRREARAWRCSRLST